jgi:predicted AAA+ superfamily ATPase
MPILSFREFLALQGAEVPPAWDLLAPPEDALARVPGKAPLAPFRRYVSEGMRPFFLEGAYGPRLLATLEKSIFADVPFFLARVSENHLRMMNAAIALLARSPIPTLNIESLARDWALGKPRVHELLDVLEHAGVIHIVRTERDRAVMSKGAKILLADPSLYAQLGGNLGSQREAFVVSMAKAVGAQVFAANDERDGDFVINGTLVEVGGQGKTRKKAAKVVRDDIEVPTPPLVPMWCLGFAY